MWTRFARRLGATVYRRYPRRLESLTICRCHYKGTNKKWKPRPFKASELIMQVNIWKIIHLNCGERYVNIDDHRIYVHNLTCIRPVTEYACLVFHNELPANLSAELEQLQKRAMRIIFPAWRRSPDGGSLSQLSFSIPSLVTQTINCMSSCHLVTIVNLI